MSSGKDQWGVNHHSLRSQIHVAQRAHELRPLLSSQLMVWLLEEPGSCWAGSKGRTAFIYQKIGKICERLIKDKSPRPQQKILQDIT